MELQETQGHEEQEFFPKGAIAFFLLLSVFMLLVWFGVYFIMIYRGA